MKLADARDAFAAALSTIDSVNVRARPPVKNPRPGDGWVVFARGVPADYTRTAATLVAVITMGTDRAASEDLLDALAVPLLDAAAAIDDLPAANIAIDPVQLPVEGGEPLNAISVTITTEVRQ